VVRCLADATAPSEKKLAAAKNSAEPSEYQRGMGNVLVAYMKWCAYSCSSAIIEKSSCVVPVVMRGTMASEPPGRGT